MITGFISDIHEDVKSLERALKVLEVKNCDEIVCLGDIAGFSQPHYRYHHHRNASECLRLVRENCSLIIPGNHDLHACRITPQSDPGFSYPDNWYELDFAERSIMANGRIWLYEDDELESNFNEADKEYIVKLPEYNITKKGKMEVLLSHYLFPDLTGSSTRMLPDSKLERSHIEFMTGKNCDISFFGHSHVEGLWAFTDDGINIYSTVNIEKLGSPLAVGLPCIADGRNEPGVATFDTLNGDIKSFRLYNFRTRYFKF